MSKYKCASCGENAYYTDFYKTSDDTMPEAVYAYCKSCSKEAWGGLRFHPKMNELFNEFFTSNFEYDPASAKDYARVAFLQE